MPVELSRQLLYVFAPASFCTVCFLALLICDKYGRDELALDAGDIQLFNILMHAPQTN